MKKLPFFILILCCIPAVAIGSALRTVNVEFSFPAAASAVKQIAGYKLYQDGKEVCRTGDGTATGLSCDITTEEGVFDFTLTALYADNSESPQSLPFPVTIGPPTTTSPDQNILEANISLTPPSGEAPLAVAFSGTGSIGDITQYSWDFGDGTKSFEESPTHVYSSAGNFTVELQVTDNSGAVRQALATVTVTPPHPDSQVPQARTLAVEFTFTPPISSAKQLSGYKLYKEGEPACITDDPGAKMLTCEILTMDGTFDFTLTALFSDNTESLPSPVFPLTIGVGGDTSPISADPLKAVISETSTTGEAPYTVYFNGINSTGDVISYHWDFGDGTADTGPVAAHTYSIPGNYEVALTVEDSYGNLHQSFTSITALPGTVVQVPPTAVISSSTAAGDAPLNITFDGTSSHSANSPIVNYTWEFGDGASATGERASHTFTQAGTYRTKLTVTDNSGLSGTVDTPIIVLGSASDNSSPTAVISTSSTAGDIPFTVNFDATQSSDADGVVTAYHWNFGDGGTANGPNVRHTYTSEGVYTATLTVSDDKQATGSTSTTITCNPQQVDDEINIEVGSVDINHEWVKVLFENRFNDPVVIAGPATFNGDQPVVTRIRNIDEKGFEIRLQEWDYLDGSHVYEAISYIVIDRGTHILSNGSRVEAGTFTGSTTFAQIPLEQDFSYTPVILSQVISENTTDAVTGRLSNIDSGSFDFKLQKMEADKRSPASETIAYIAWEPGSGDFAGLRYETGLTSQSVTEDWSTLPYQTEFSEPLLVLAAIQTYAGGDTAALRTHFQSPVDIRVKVEEEQSKDAEVWHKAESVGFILFGETQ